MQTYNKLSNYPKILAGLSKKTPMIAFSCLIILLIKIQTFTDSKRMSIFLQSKPALLCEIFF